MTLAADPDPQGTPLDGFARGESPSHTLALRERYEAYCGLQASLLLEIIPREAVRPLYRRARTWASERGSHDLKDPMATLRCFCRELLPLPPFEVWCLDYQGHRLAHVSEGMERSPSAGPMEPIAVAISRIEHDAEPWQGTLEVYRGGKRGGGSFASGAMERRATSAPVRSSARMIFKTFVIASCHSLRLP